MLEKNFQTVIKGSAYSHQDRVVTDFFLPNIVRVLDLSLGFFSGVVCFACRPWRSSLSSAYLGL